eukprot:GHVR01110802.1.p1 GENE.GHVR01110802.1~~GHVR01110802.1.p1  ORF type:complete len:159 (+),score=53.36 GHVR01110802.1:362-838(+)
MDGTRKGKEFNLRSSAQRVTHTHTQGSLSIVTQMLKEFGSHTVMRTVTKEACSEVPQGATCVHPCITTDSKTDIQITSILDTKTVTAVGLFDYTKCNDLMLRTLNKLSKGVTKSYMRLSSYLIITGHHIDYITQIFKLKHHHHLREGIHTHTHTHTYG